MIGLIEHLPLFTPTARVPKVTMVIKEKLSSWLGLKGGWGVGWRVVWRVGWRVEGGVEGGVWG